jgi:rubrerythrin
MPHYKIDPELEKCLPPLPDETYQAIKASIAKDGYDPAKPIVLWEEHVNTIVDGHHRYRACLELGVEPVAIEESFKSLDEALLYTLRRQTEQRDLTVAQRIIIEKQILGIEGELKLKAEAKAAISGRPPKLSPPGGETFKTTREVAQQIAKRAGVSSPRVYEVNAVEVKGEPELMGMMASGKLSSGSANRFVQRIPKEKQAEIIKSGGVAAVNAVASELRKEIEQRGIAEREPADRLKAEQDKERNDIREYKTVLKEQFGDAKYSCGLSSVNEFWCNDCKCAFDVFKPSEAKCCPSCSGKSIVQRDPTWYPGKKVN